MGRVQRTVRSSSLPFLVALAALGVGCEKKPEQTTLPAASASAVPSSAPSATLKAVATASAAPVASTPTVLATGQNRPVALVADEKAVYWVNHGVDANGKEQLGLGAVMWAPRQGGDPAVIADKLDMPTAVAVDSTHIYWSALRGVRKAPKSGGAAANLVTLGEGDSHGMPVTLAVNADTVFVGTFHMKNGGVYRVPKKGGALRELDIGFMTADAIATDATDVFVCLNGDVLGRIPKNGGENDAVLLGKGLRKCSSVAVDDTHVYWTEAGAGTLKRAAKKDGSAPIVLAESLRGPQSVTVDGGEVYWLEKEAGRLARIEKEGGAVAPLASSLKAPQGLAVSNGTAFWCEPSEGTVSKLVFDSDAAAKAPVPAASASSVGDTKAPPKKGGLAPGKCKTDTDCGGTGWCNPFGNCDYRATAQ